MQARPKGEKRKKKNFTEFALNILRDTDGREKHRVV